MGVQSYKFTVDIFCNTSCGYRRISFPINTWLYKLTSILSRIINPQFRHYHVS